MQIGELARLSGVSARALRHYEDRGLVIPNRTAGGYRDYSAGDVTRVAKVKAMVAAGLPTASIRRYFDCARSGERSVFLDLCPELRAELEAIAACLDTKRQKLSDTRRRLREIAPVGSL